MHWGEGRYRDSPTTLKSHNGWRHVITPTVQIQLGVVGKSVFLHYACLIRLQPSTQSITICHSGEIGTTIGLLHVAQTGPQQIMIDSVTSKAAVRSSKTQCTDLTLISRELQVIVHVGKCRFSAVEGRYADRVLAWCHCHTLCYISAIRDGNESVPVTHWPMMMK